MIKYILVAAVLLCSFLLRSSNNPTPQKYLETAVLNSTQVAGFAGNALSGELEKPPMKMNENGVMVPMSRRELIESKISFSEKVLSNINRMMPPPDAVDIISTSIALHEFVIEVYETDYTTLARMYDDGVSKEQIAAFDATIKNKYADMFALHYENLIRGGKLYAAKHQLPVKGII